VWVSWGIEVEVGGGGEGYRDVMIGLRMVVVVTVVTVIVWEMILPARSRRRESAVRVSIFEGQWGGENRDAGLWCM